MAPPTATQNTWPQLHTFVNICCRLTCWEAIPRVVELPDLIGFYVPGLVAPIRFLDDLVSSNDPFLPCPLLPCYYHGCVWIGRKIRQPAVGHHRADDNRDHCGDRTSLNYYATNNVSANAKHYGCSRKQNRQTNGACAQVVPGKGRNKPATRFLTVSDSGDNPLRNNGVVDMADAFHAEALRLRTVRGGLLALYDRPSSTPSNMEGHEPD